MTPALLELNLIDTLKRNFSLNEKYFEYEYKIFYELEPVVHEIGKCLILQLNYATITMTNHVLERLLKLALIHKAVGIAPKSIHQLNNIFISPTQKYGSLSLGNSIEHCKKEKLIDSEERNFLFDFVRETLRNGFSHGDAAKVLSEMADETKYYRANSENTAWIEMILNPKMIPQLQAAHMENFANEHASSYFDFVFELLRKIEIRLIGFGTADEALGNKDRS